MSDTIKVTPAEGVRVPVMGMRGEFYGYRRVTSTSLERARAAGDLAFEIPGGGGYVATGPVEVQNSRYVRRMLRRGALLLEVPKTPALKKKGSRRSSSDND